MLDVLKKICDIRSFEDFKTFASTFEGGSIILFIGSNIGAAFSYLYQLMYSRFFFTTEEYGIFMSFWSAFVILIVGLYSIVTIIAQYVSFYHVNNDPDGLHIFMRKIRRGFFFFSIASFFLLLALSPFFNQYVKVHNYGYNLILIFGFALYLYVTPYAGLVQGTQNFIYLSLYLIAMGVVKVGAGVVFAFLGWEIYGAFLALVVTFLSLFIVFRKPVKDLVPKDLEKAKKSFKYPTDNFLRKFLCYGMVVVVANILWNMLAMSDVVFAKRFFNPTESGVFSAAAVLARIILFLPIGIILAVFPKVSECNHKGISPIHVLNKSLLIVGALSVSAGLAFFLMPEFIMKIMLGSKNLPSAPIFKYLGPTLVPVIIVSLLMNYQLARMKSALILTTMGLGLVVQVVMISYWHSCPMDIIKAVFYVNSAIVVINLLCIYLEEAFRSKSPAIID